MIIVTKAIKYILRWFYSIIVWFFDILHFFYGFFYLACKAKKRGFPIKSLWPFLSDRHESAGAARGHYFLQDIFIAKEINSMRPKEHFDIGSRIDGLISHLLCLNVHVTMIDIRPMGLSIENLRFIEADATNLESLPDCSVKSLSSLHAVEHFGLGRYGDKYDIDAADKAMNAFQRVLEINGRLYFSVPISRTNRIDYNGCRVYTPLYVLERFDKLELEKFGYIHDDIIEVYDSTDAMSIIENNKFGKYDCGCFVFRKVLE